MDIEERVKTALDQVRGYLQSHGGDVEFIELTPDNTVRVKLTGACGGCPMAAQTLKRGVEAMVKKAVPEVTAVEEA